MKKLIPILLFSATTLHTVIGVSPSMALGCDAHLNKSEVVCEDSDKQCKEKSESNID